MKVNNGDLHMHISCLIEYWQDFVLLTKNYQILQSAFYEEGCVSVSMTIGESSFAIDIFIHLKTYIDYYKIEH